jgi:hypothetical protein
MNRRRLKQSRAVKLDSCTPQEAAYRGIRWGASEEVNRPLGRAGGLAKPDQIEVVHPRQARTKLLQILQSLDRKILRIPPPAGDRVWPRPLDIREALNRRRHPLESSEEDVFASLLKIEEHAGQPRIVGIGIGNEKVGANVPRV